MRNWAKGLSANRTKLQAAIDDVQQATIDLDAAQTDYERFATFSHVTAQIAYAQRKKPAMMRAELALNEALDRLLAAGWVKPRALIEHQPMTGRLELHEYE